MSEFKRILLLINPKARSGSGTYDEIADTLSSKGHQILEISVEEKKMDSNDMIRKYRKEVDVIVVGGGDGSINYILPALVETKIPLLVYPLGTANLLARSFEMRADLQQLTEILQSGKIIPIDLGKVNDKLFINVCGLGISTEVNRRVTSRLKKLTGPFSFWITGMKLRKTLRPFKIILSVDGASPITTRTWQITVCNGRRYGAWMNIAQDASYNDGILHCLSTEVSKRWEGIKLLPSYLKGNYKESDDVTLVAGKKIKIETTHPLQIDVDGDVQTSTPAIFEVMPRSMNLLVPGNTLKENSCPFDE